jgi:hypothetical protein
MIFLSAVLIAGCASSGLSANVKKDLQAKLAIAEKPIASCYEKALKNNPALKGKVLVKFKLAEDSKVLSGVEIASSDLKDQDVEKCIVLETSDLRLGEPADAPASVSYPLEFEPKAEPKAETKPETKQ